MAIPKFSYGYTKFSKGYTKFSYTVIKAFSCVALLPVILGIITSTNW